MANDVATLEHDLSGYSNEEEACSGGKPATLVTRDLLEGCLKAGQQELELELDNDLYVPFGYEKLLDITSGKIYIEPIPAAKSNPSPRRATYATSTCPGMLLPSSPTRRPPDLNLVSSSTSAQATVAAFQSVCTLEKVNSALKRAEQEKSSSAGKKRSASADASPVTSAEAKVIFSRK